MANRKNRLTHQRQLILEELCAVKSHPTADELYDMVRHRLPKISLATVYRNLEWLTEQSMIQKIEVGGRQKRFDGNTTPHCHIRCVECGKVDDIEMDPLNDLVIPAEQAHGYKVLGHRLEIQGICPQCNNTH